MEEIAGCWEERDWLRALEEAHRRLAGHEYRDIAPPRISKHKHIAQETRWISIADTGCRLTNIVRNVSIHLPKGFTRLDSSPSEGDIKTSFLPPPFTYIQKAIHKEGTRETPPQPARSDNMDPQRLYPLRY